MTDAPALTRSQYNVLEALLTYMDRCGFAPSTHELCDLTGMTSTSSVVYQLKNLEQKGYIARAPGRARAIVVLRGTEGTELWP